MSGHSKWAQIKRQKGVADIKRGQTFTKVANAITIAVRAGGGVSDPSQNFRLRLAIEKGRSLNMPRENIERAIGRAKGKTFGANIEEVVYEGFGPGQVFVLVEAATDNKMRTSSEIKNIFDKNGGRLTTPGSTSYIFETKGLITLSKNTKSVDDIFLLAADAGAEDLEEAGDEVLIYTKPEDLNRVKEALSKDFPGIRLELTRKAKTKVTIGDEETKKLIEFIGKLEELDDVQKVYVNNE